MAETKLQKRLEGVSPRQRELELDRAAKARAREMGVIRSDVRLQWDKAVDTLAAELEQQQLNLAASFPELGSDHGLDWREQAELMLKPALPERLRELV